MPDEAGATDPYGRMLPVMPTGADPSTWDDCVTVTKAAVDNQFAKSGGHLVRQQVPPSAGTRPETAVALP
jgi:hypothetical protein